MRTFVIFCKHFFILVNKTIKLGNNRQNVLKVCKCAYRYLAGSGGGAGAGVGEGAGAGAGVGTARLGRAISSPEVNSMIK